MKRSNVPYDQSEGGGVQITKPNTTSSSAQRVTSTTKESQQDTLLLPSSSDNQQLISKKMQLSRSNVKNDAPTVNLYVESAEKATSPVTQRKQESIGHLADFFGVSAEIKDNNHSGGKIDAVAALHQSNEELSNMKGGGSTEVRVRENVLQKSKGNLSTENYNSSKEPANQRSGYLLGTPPTEDGEEDRHDIDNLQSSYMLLDTTGNSDNGGGIGAALSRSTKEFKSSIPSPPPGPPDDFIASDGHLWRSKFCIFTDGVLYFYKNQDEADSIEAQKERENATDVGNESVSAVSSSSADYLSKSPMTRPNYLLSSIIVSDGGSSHLWEKRVAIDNVGACLSSEEFCVQNSFVLFESGNKEHGGNPPDTLILKAGSSADMDDWMLQFQRSIASLMRKIILSVDQTKMHSSLPSDILLPRSRRFKGTVAAPRTTVIPSPKHASSPVIPPFLSLSHGHGRNDMHRRRLVSKGLSSTKADTVVDDSYQPPTDHSESTTSPINQKVSTPSTAAAESVSLSPASELKVNKYVPPHLRKGSTSGKYIPPHLRKKKDIASMDSAGKRKSHNLPTQEKRDMTRGDKRKNDEDETPPAHPLHIQLGGCAEDSSKLRRNRKKSSVSSFGGETDALRWEVGGISDVGKRDSNEDSFVCVSNFALACDCEKADNIQAMFAIFDGHCGSSAARFAANKIVPFFYEALLSIKIQSINSETTPTIVKEHLLNTIARLDHEICSKTEWECGSTALVALIVEEHVVVANLGDCRGVVCRSSMHEEYSFPEKDEWNFSDLGGSDSYAWKEVTKTHSPSGEGEKERIEDANGWITHEREVCISQLQRVDLFDEDVIDILKRCFSERLSGSNLSECEDGVIGRQRSAPGRIFHASRVCGELAVSRALGDKDFKAKYNTSGATKEGWWKGPSFLPYSDSHSKCFQGDLVIATPDIEIFSIGDEEVHQEFLLLACDGLWDVMEPDDAIRVARDLLFTKQTSAEVAVSETYEH